jgi:hypothetical protein
LVEKTVISRGSVFGLRREGRMRKETERAESVVDGNQNDALSGQRGAIEDERMAVSRAVAPAVEPNHNGSSPGLPIDPCPNVEEKAVLADLHLAAAINGSCRPDGLPTGCSKALGVTNAFPFPFLRRWLPPQRTDRRLGKRYAAIHENILVVVRIESLELTGIRLDDWAQRGITRASGE